MRAMVLAAGFGTRLRPLTDSLPKPLIPVANRPLITYALAQLVAAGVRDAVVNLHHLGTAIPAALGEDGGLGLSLSWSEEPEILGTGGGLVQARPLLGEETFYLLNGDVLSGVDLTGPLEFHRAHGAVATMVVRPQPLDAKYTPLQVDQAGRLVSFGDVQLSPEGEVRDCMFCGIHVLEPDVFDFLPEAGFSCVNQQGYSAMLRAGLPVAACWYDGPWFDLGTPARYLDASFALVSGRAAFPQLDAPGAACSEDGVLIDPTAQVDPTARLGPDVVVGPRCRIGREVQLERCILWPDTPVADGQAMHSVILTPDHRVES